MSSPKPRNRVIAAWVWAFTIGGLSRRPSASITSSPVSRLRRWAELRDQAILHPQADRLAIQQRSGDRETHLASPAASTGRTDSSAAFSVSAVRSRPALVVLDRQRLIRDAVGEVVDRADSGVGQAGLTGQHRLGGQGHPDHVRNPGERSHLRGRLEARAAGLRVDASVDEVGLGVLAPRVQDLLPPVRIEAGDRVAAGVVVEARRGLGRVEVVGTDEGPDLEIEAEAARRAQRQHAAAAELAEGPDVGAMVDEVRRDAAIESVPGQPDDLAGVDRLHRPFPAGVDARRAPPPPDAPPRGGCSRRPRRADHRSGAERSSPRL